ncbi:hypothetical protein U1Q18_009128 [Sarracenia purpurea var. burkii]
MGLVESLEWVNNCGKRQWSRLFWRMRAAVKKAAKGGAGKRQLKFQYDPWSYALNFDDGGGCCLEERENGGFFSKAEGILVLPEATAWVYVLWLEYSC